MWTGVKIINISHKLTKHQLTRKYIRDNCKTFGVENSSGPEFNCNYVLSPKEIGL